MRRYLIPVLFAFAGKARFIQPERAISQEEAVSGIFRAEETVYGSEEDHNLELLETEITQARAELERHSILYRMIPEIRISAGIGAGEIVFTDPYDPVPYILPRDIYRLTISFSFNEIFDCKGKRNAEFALKKLLIRYERAKEIKSANGEVLKNRLKSVEALTALTGEELNMMGKICSFDSLMFRRGNKEYGSQVKSHLELLKTRKTMARLLCERESILIKLKNGAF